MGCGKIQLCICSYINKISSLKPEKEMMESFLPCEAWNEGLEQEEVSCTSINMRNRGTSPRGGAVN
jgi:hypothetical protein